MDGPGGRGPPMDGPGGYRGPGPRDDYGPGGGGGGPGDYRGPGPRGPGPGPRSPRDGPSYRGMPNDGLGPGPRGPGGYDDRDRGPVPRTFDQNGGFGDDEPPPSSYYGAADEGKQMEKGDHRRPLEMHEDDIHGQMPPSSNSSISADSAEDRSANEGKESDEADYETVAKGGPNDPMVQCLIVRDRSGLKRLNPEYNLYLQGGRKKGSEKLILIAKKQAHKNGCSYHIYNVSRGHMGGRLRKKGGNYVGKLKCSGTKIENVMYNNEEVKDEIGAVLFAKPTIMDHMRDGAQPRKLKVVLPPADENSLPIPQKNKFNDPYAGLLGQLQSDQLEEGCRQLERKEPVFENGNYRLNFHGRVTVPSVKNFQLVDPRDVADVICQFGKIDDDRFHLDFKGPLNPFQAFCVTLAQFNY